MLENVQILTLLPPIIAILLALLTKEVLSSLFIGVALGALLNNDFHIINGVQAVFETMGGTLGGNASIIIFLCLLGILVILMGKAGGSLAYGEWASKKIKKRSGAMLATSALGALIFVDDYFNCLTVGTVMRPLTDKHNISRAKLAYIIDSTAAPICIIAPISSWALAVGGTISESADGINGFTTFIQTIPYNLYAIMTIVMVIALCITQKDFGKMKKFELNAKTTGDLFSSNGDKMVSDDQSFTPSKKGKVIDLLLPILSMVIVSILVMFYTGGLFDKANPVNIAEAMGNCDAYISMVIGGFVAIMICAIMYLPRKLLSFSEFMKSFQQGIKAMVPAIIVLVLAWTLVQICKDMGTAAYISGLIEKSQLSLKLLPAIVFVVGAALAFATGTSWGTFGILLTFVVPVAMGQDIFVLCIAATLAGAVLGDHISPISDTTILASTGAECNHLDHVKTQLPYALTIGVVCFIGYLIGGLTAPWVSILVSALLMPLVIFLLIKKGK